MEDGLGSPTVSAAVGGVLGQRRVTGVHSPESARSAAARSAEFPGERELHLVMDDYGTHKTPAVQQWLRRHARFVPHFIPTSSSWVNLAERWFRELTDKAVRRGAFVSVPDLMQAIDAFLAAWNDAPKPFVWTAKVDEILRKIEWPRGKLEAIKPGCTQPRRRQKREE